MGHTCRGTINLATANIAVEDSCNFVISNGGAQTYHLKANSEVERQRWITALELAKAKAVHMQAESGKNNRNICSSLECNIMTQSGCLFVYLCKYNFRQTSKIVELLFLFSHSISIICFFLIQMTLVMIVHQCLQPQPRVEAAALLKCSLHCAP